MDTHRRMPLHDLPLGQFLIPGSITATKTPRKHKRPLSPSRTTPLNPAKRRVLDVEAISLSKNVVTSSSFHPVPFMLPNMHTVTPSRSSRLGNGYNYLSEPCTVDSNVVLGSPEIAQVPKQRRLPCQRTKAHLPANFTSSRSSNHPLTRSLGTILVSTSFETLNIAGAAQSRVCPCPLLAMLKSIDSKRTRRMYHSRGRRRSSVQRNDFCPASMVWMHPVMAHSHR